MGLNRGFTYREIIGRVGDGTALLEYLAGRYGHSTEGEWRCRADAGLVRVNGKAAAGGWLRLGDVLTWHRPPWEEPCAPLVYAVLLKDDALVAVAKPSGLPTLPGGGFLENTLLALVRRRYPEASPAHRLGRGTSGVVLFTRSAPAGRLVSQAWRDRRVAKVYRALVEGEPKQDAFEVEEPIGPASHPALGFVYSASRAGKRSKSRIRVLERRGATSLVEVTIETGRPHQIRIHMAACGHPLAGDPLYAPGGGFLERAGLPGDTGYHLHAERLVLPHPATGQPFEVWCRPPKVLRVGEG